MAIIYRTDGAWGSGQGTNLSPAQVDGNFYDVTTRVSYIEDNPVEPITPIAINIEGGQFTMGLSDGSTLGPITITYPMPLWRGDWAPSVEYNEMDFFTAPDGGLGAVMISHTSAATFDWGALSGGAPIYQQLVGGSGTTSGIADLTDVALGTQADNDMLVWDGPAALWRNETPAAVVVNLPAFGGSTGSTAGAKGIVPAPAAGDNTAGKFLSAGGGWAVPATGSGGSTSLAGLSDVSISSPVDLSLLQYHATDGKWHNATLAALGSGTVTSVDSGAGLAGGPITATGILSLAPIGTNTLLANTTGGTAVPAGVSLSVLLDAAIGSARGSILRRGASTWAVLTPGSAGTYLRSGGAGADLSWDAPAGSGTVTSITTTGGVTGGPITGSGTISLDPIATSRVLANISGATLVPTPVSVALLLDNALGTTQGSILYRSATAWVALPPGTAGQVLATGGAGANPSWAAGGGAGISVGDTPPASPSPGAAWWDSVGGQLYIRYQDPTGPAQWVPASNQPGPQGPAGSANMSGMTAGQIPVAATATSVTSSIPLPLTVAQGGTGATTAAAALTNLGALPLAGGTMTGTMTLQTPTALVLRKPSAGDSNNIYGNGNGGQPRWVLSLGDSGAESGSNSGSNFSVARFNDAGTFIDYPFTISRATGDATFSSNLTIGGATATKPGGGPWVAPSDRSLKSGAVPWHTGLDEVLQLEVIAYKYNNAAWNLDDTDYVGVDAEDAAAIIPEMGRIVSVPADDVLIVDPHAPPGGVPPGHQTVEVAGIESGPLIFALVNAVKELAARLDKLEKPGVVQ